MSEIGKLSLFLAFLCSCYAVGAFVLGLRTGMASPLRSGRRAVWMVCGLSLLASILLIRALVLRDFSYRYVAEHTSLDLPKMYAFSSLWAGQEGSLLLWAWLLGPFIDAWLKVHPRERPQARQFLRGFIDHLREACVGSISEIFDAEAPYTPRGCIAQAWSVAEVLRCWVKTGTAIEAARGVSQLAAQGTLMPGQPEME